MRNWSAGELDLHPEELIILQTAYEKYGRMSFKVSAANSPVAWDLFRDGFLTHRDGKFTITDKGAKAIQIFGYKRKGGVGGPTGMIGGYRRAGGHPGYGGSSGGPSSHPGFSPEVVKAAEAGALHPGLNPGQQTRSRRKPPFIPSLD